MNGKARVCGQTVKVRCDSLLMSVCGSVGRGEPLWEWNGPPWEYFIEHQCGRRRGTDRGPNLVGWGGTAANRTPNFVACCNLPYFGD